MLFKLFNTRYIFKFNFKFFILCLLLSITCCYLGTWQLHRFAFKKILITTYAERIKQNPQPLQNINLNKDVQFQKVLITGSYQNELTIVQNRFYQNKAGFEIFTPFHIVGEKRGLLIDRGWIPASAINDIAAMPSTITLKGYLKYLNEYQFILGENIVEPQKKPWVVQRLDLKELERLTHQEYYPFILRLDRSQLYGFTRDWVVSTVPPSRHLGYAVQWFALAFVIFISYGFFCLEKLDTQND